MGGLTGVVLAFAALLSAVVVLLARQRAQRRRIETLTRQTEAFLRDVHARLPVCLEEHELAPLHNAVADLESRVLLARAHEAEECQRTSALTADISHQLKTPLASLRLFCELDAGPHLAEQVGQIDRMEALISALLHLERLCADGYPFSFSACMVRDVTMRAWEELQDLYPRKRVTMEGDGRVRCDPRWLGEALRNLLKNACEHTAPEGRIQIKVTHASHTLLLSIQDDGGGVPDSALPHLFERFYRAGDGAGTGAGLGLAITREIIYRHHGLITAENAGAGLRLTVSLPFLEPGETA